MNTRHVTRTPPTYPTLAAHTHLAHTVYTLPISRPREPSPIPQDHVLTSWHEDNHPWPSHSFMDMYVDVHRPRISLKNALDPGEKLFQVIISHHLCILR